MTKIKNISEDEYFESGLWRYDMKPHEDMNVLTYIEHEDTERYDEMTGSYKYIDYEIERNGVDMSLYALISTGFTEEDIDLDKLNNALIDMEETNNFIVKVPVLDEIYIFIKYRQFDDDNFISPEQQVYNAIVLFDEVEYETLSRIKKDIFDIIEVVNKLANHKMVNDWFDDFK